MHFSIEINGHTFVVHEALLFPDLIDSDLVKQHPENHYILFHRPTHAPKSEHTNKTFFFKRELEEGDEAWIHFECGFYDETTAETFIEYFNKMHRSVRI